MRYQGLVGACLLALASSTVADYLAPNKILWGPKGSAGAKMQKRATSTSSAAASSTSKVADAACTNGPLTRNCWSSGYSVATDFDSKWPTTGVTRSYSLEITNTTCNPDGSHQRTCLLYNNQYPGPLIWANWGDTVSVTVKNSMQGNGTGIHFHGIRQYGTNTEDGVNGLTECPLAPGDTKTYTWKATQFGTSWYHSHFSAQYGDGAAGPIVIYGPASSNYDVDLGSYTINDWYYQTAYQINDAFDVELQQGQPGPPGDTILINGTNQSPSGTGSYNKVTMTKGKKYRLRLVNMSLDNNIRVSLDGHPFQVISSDLVPVKPYTTNWVMLAIGQRHDVIITANQTSGNFWFRAEVATDCASANNYYGRSVFTYADATYAVPTTSAATAPTVCKDESPLVPWVQNSVPSSDFANQVQNLEVDINVEQVTTNGQNVVVWGVNLTAINVAWDMPTLEYVKQGNASYPKAYNLIELPTSGIWTYWIIQETSGTPVPIPHPIHLHGHDFYVLGTGSGVFDKSSSVNTLSFSNPVRRDVTFLPGGGWLALAFPTDNAGAWLMHCHIAWHISEGLGVQFLESKSTINLPGDAWEKTCTNWKTYWKSPAWPKTDSGL